MLIYDFHKFIHFKHQIKATIMAHDRKQQTSTHDNNVIWSREHNISKVTTVLKCVPKILNAIDLLSVVVRLLFSIVTFMRLWHSKREEDFVSMTLLQSFANTFPIVRVFLGSMTDVMENERK